MCNARRKKIEQEANAGWELNRRHVSHVGQRACQLGRESRNAKVIVHVVRWGGNLSSVANRQQTRTREKKRYRTFWWTKRKKTDKARENSVSPWFLHVFGIFVHLKRTHKHVSEMKTEKRRFVYRLIQMPNDVCNESRPKQGEAEQWIEVLELKELKIFLARHKAPQR